MAPETFNHTVGALWTKTRLDAYLTKHFDGRFSRTELKRALDGEKILLNGKVGLARDAVKEGDRIEGELPETPPSTLVPENIDLKIIHEDASIVVVDKPAGMVVHPGAGTQTGTLVHALLGRETQLAESDDPTRPGIVHRLDKETSGVLVVAKTSLAHRKLSEQFAERSLTKIYRAVVQGRMEFDEGRYEEPIGRDKSRRILMAVPARRAGGRRDDQGRPAETRYKVIKRFASTSDLEVRILTGRTHQIRVHFSHGRHPVLGDRLYAPAPVMRAAARLMLHAWKIEFLHPKTGKLVKFESPLPADFKAELDRQK